MGMFGFDGQARVMKEDTGSVGMKVGMVGLMVEREKVMEKRNEETGYEDEWNERRGLTGCVRNRGCRVIPDEQEEMRLLRFQVRERILCSGNGSHEPGRIIQQLFGQ